ncbi:MAG: DUF5054 domain-containing protein [Chloroflexi bacterium]|nr:DUF5054 domain-containing protein [Chloroflexota bacterium]OJW06209.1 MAG: hypothetical protein BGO39_25515 [Chloroflexi bacterium 54-19]
MLELEPQVKEVDLIFKTHLDIGFTDYARNVVNNYFTGFIPQALKVSRQLREENRPERFIWTTGSWLIYEFLEKAPPARRAELEAAIEAGDIRWHGLPFTTHSELLDSSLFEFGLSLSQELDRRFGKKTIAAKMTDVPGHTRSIVPLLAAAGIEFLHIGVNPASTPPDVPPVFVWRDQLSHSDVIVIYQKGSYGDLTVVPGLDAAIAFAHTVDNLGPQSPDEIIHEYDKMRQKFPGAILRASTMDDYALKLRTVKGSLPVINAELGDTWIHGAGSDPKKIAQYRELARLRRAWLAEAAPASAAAIKSFSRSLMLVPEHTWGLDEKTYLADTTNYAPADLRVARETLPKFKKFEESWDEQRAYITEAVAALEGTPLAGEAQAALAKIEPQRPDLAGFEPISDFTKVFETTHFEVGFDGQTGAINRLVRKDGGRNWAGSDNRMGLFQYETFSAQDYKRFWDQYIINKDDPNTSWWAIQDFTKPGMEKDGAPEHTRWEASLVKGFWNAAPAEPRFLFELTLPEAAFEKYGGPKELWLGITFPADRPSVEFELQWFGKPATRLPEAAWFSFNPAANPALMDWELEKMGRLVSPLEVIPDGNRHLHGVSDGGVFLFEENARLLQIQSLDAPLVAPGDPSLLDFNNEQPRLEHGMHFNLYNNVWGTNFAMWYDEDSRFRFSLNF